MMELALQNIYKSGVSEKHMTRYYPDIIY